MKKNRTMLSFGLIVSTLIAIFYLVGNIEQLKETGYQEISLFACIVSGLIIIANIPAFITTDRNNEEFQKVKWRSWLAIGLYMFLYILILVLFIVQSYSQKFIAAAVLIIATTTLFLLIIGVNTKTISEYEENKLKENNKK